MDGCTYEWMGGWIGRCVNVRIVWWDVWIDGWVEWCWVIEWMDGWVLVAWIAG